MRPALNLSYNSGSGNSPFGLGWSLSLGGVSRRTDKRLPRYREDGDVFSLTGGDDLVPWRDEDGGAWTRRDETVGGLRITRYRSRVGPATTRIERLRDGAGGDWWKVTSAQNVTTLYGYSSDARIADPADDSRIYSWLPEITYDDKGNWMRYAYKAEDLANVQHDVHERNRFNELAAFANRYLKRAQYGNHLPWFADDPYQPTLPDEDAAFFFEWSSTTGNTMLTSQALHPVRVWSGPAREMHFPITEVDLRCAPGDCASAS